MKLYFRLVKFPLSLTVAGAFLAGYLIGTPLIEPGIEPGIKSGIEFGIDDLPFILFLSVLSLACGCACLNNYQDRFLDRRFSRTKDRPLPMNKIPHRRALVLAVVLILMGLFGFYRHSFLLIFLGLLAVCCYNLLYTPLKRKSMWAMLPGVICGMLPPWMGWLSAGGEVFSYKIWLIMAIFGVWQMPHYWLLVLAYDSDFKRSGLPNMLSCLLTEQLKRILLVWVVSLAALTLCLPLAQLVQTNSAFVALAVNSAGLVLAFYLLLFSARQMNVYRALFIHLNLAVFISMTILVIDRTFLFQ